MFHFFLTRRAHEVQTLPKMRFATPLPFNRVEVGLHRTSEAYPPAKVDRYVSYGPYSAGSQLQDKPVVLSIGNGQEDGV